MLEHKKWTLSVYWKLHLSKIDYDINTSKSENTVKFCSTKHLNYVS